MKILYLLLLLCCILCGVDAKYSKIEQLSLKQSIDLLKIIDQLELINVTSIDCHTLCKNFTELTDKTCNKKTFQCIKPLIYQIIHDNYKGESYFMKVYGLLTFRGLINIICVLATVGFIISAFKDLLLTYSAYMLTILYTIFLSDISIYIGGYSLSFATIYWKYSDLAHNGLSEYTKYFLFENYTCLFGITLFSAITQYLCRKSKMNWLAIILPIWITVAIYHDNWFVATIAVIILFTLFGFCAGSFGYGYYAGFNNEQSIEKCFIISVILDIVFLAYKFKYIDNELMKYFVIFETGILFCGTFVGSIAMLIMSSEYYWNYNTHSYFIMKIFECGYYLTLIYIGNVYHIQYFLSIGGTFLVLCGLDFESYILHKISTGSVTGLLLVIAINAYGLMKLLEQFPKYWLIQ
jgi:hypothetical protein